MEHGVLGEARAKAFLLDRFWVLERSVDVQGADLLVQLRDARASLLDPSSSRVGFVQVKFLQDENTTISIPSAYVRDENGSPHGEFFLLVSTGAEDSERLFLLSAADVCLTFREVNSAGRSVLRLSGRALLTNSNYEVRSRRIALDRIEHALRSASLVANRRYLRNLGASAVSPDQIDEDYILPLQNWWGDIPRAFYGVKVGARSVLYELEEVADALDALLQSTDPDEASKIYHDRISSHVVGGQLRFSANDIADDDLAQVAREQKHHLERVRTAGIAGAYFEILHRFDEAALSYARGTRNPAMSAIHATITYRPDDLSAIAIELAGEEERCQGQLGPDGYAVVLTSIRGKHVLCYDARHALNHNDWNDPTRDPAALHLPFQHALDLVLLGPSTQDGYF